MWSDNETLADCIDYAHLVSAVASIVDNDALLPCSIGIYGDWGSGKSSLMQMIEKNYEGQPNTLVIKFNGWLFEGYEDTKTVLMRRIVDAIIDKRNLTPKAISLASKLLKKIDWFKVSIGLGKYAIAGALAGPAGLAAVGGTDILKSVSEVNYEDYVKAKSEGTEVEDSYRNNIQEFHSNFSELIRESNLQRVIVFIDDLDRCSPDTVIGTLEAIKLFLFTENTAFIIGADERLIKYAVRRRFPEMPGDNIEVGRDYLEKLIQYPIRIPPLNTMELTTYINLLFTELHSDAGAFGLVREKILKRKNGEAGYEFMFDAKTVTEFLDVVSEDLKEALVLSAQIIPVLTDGLNGNPRQSKRFLNTLLLRHKMASSKGIDLNKRTLAKLMLLEYFKSESFTSFNQLQSSHSGVIPQLKDVEAVAKGEIKASVAKLPKEFEEYLKDDWLKKWFASDHSLAEVNLQPYYFFSRDKLAAFGSSLQRMSPSAQEYFRKIMSDAQSIRNTALDSAKDLSVADAAAVFETLVQKVRENGDGDLVDRVCAFCQARVELLSQLLEFIKTLPVTIVKPVIVTRLQELTTSTDYRSSAKEIVQRWSSNSENRLLARISKSKLKDFE